MSPGASRSTRPRAVAGESRDNDGYAWPGHYAVSRAYTVNGLNQYIAAGGAGFSYDANGNLATTPGPNGQTISYGYDIENRLVSASPGVTLAYDPLGRLLSGHRGERHHHLPLRRRRARGGI